MPLVALLCAVTMVGSLLVFHLSAAADNARHCARFAKASALRAAADTGSGDRVVVIGGGLLGLEAAYGLAKAGAKVTVLHLMDRLMERQLDAPAAELLKSLVELKGIKILLNANTARFHGETCVEGATTASSP